MQVSFQPGFRWTGRQFVGGSPVLDFCNTVVFHRWPERRLERMTGPGDLAAWLAVAQEHGLERGGPAEPVRIADETLFLQALYLRDLSRDLFAAAAAGRPPDPRALAGLLALAGPLLAEGDFSAGRLALAPGRPHPISALLCASALDLLWRGPLDRLRACPNCDYLFLDRSRSRTRKWCDMQVCGNRAKAERFAGRHGRTT